MGAGLADGCGWWGGEVPKDDETCLEILWNLRFTHAHYIYIYIISINDSIYIYTYTHVIQCTHTYTGPKWMVSDPLTGLDSP